MELKEICERNKEKNIRNPVYSGSGAVVCSYEPFRQHSGRTPAHAKGVFPKFFCHDHRIFYATVFQTEIPHSR